MILPSDGATPSGDEEDDDEASGKKNPEEWWSDDDEDEDGDGEGDETDDDDMEEGEEEELSSPVKAPAGPGWRNRLRRELLGCIADLKEIEDPDQDFDPPEPPDLYTFFGELAAMRNETRQAGRRAATGIEQTAEALRTVRDLLAAGAAGKPAEGEGETPPATEPFPWSVELCLSLMALHDLVAEARPGEALEISFAVLMRAAGMERISAEGKAFDPARMTVTGVEITPGQAPGKVLRVTEAGFLRAGVLLRPARVVITG